MTAPTEARADTLDKAALDPLLAGGGDLAHAFVRSVRRGRRLLSRSSAAASPEEQGSTGELIARIGRFFGSA